MKKKLFRAIALALALVTACGLALADVRTTASVNLRSGPGKNYDIVTSFSAGKTLTYLGETKYDDRNPPVAWYKVSSGKHTGWVSSTYAVLEDGKSQPAATAAPTAAPTPLPTAEPTPTPAPAFEFLPTATSDGEAAGLPALNAGSLFANGLSGEDSSAETTLPDITVDAKNVELSTYYRADLVTAANELGLISYREVDSEAPYQYYNDSLILAGNQNVENIVVYGGGYEVYGVYVGMNANTAMAWLNAAGLDYVDSVNGLTYEHKAAPDAPFADEHGHDSCINLWIDDSNIVTEIDWSTYTG